MNNAAEVQQPSDSIPVERAQRLMAMGQMAASLAHEIRNPLGSMELFCSLLKKDLHGQDALYDLADQIHQGIRRLEGIIANCLQFSRDITPRLAPIASVKHFLAECLNDLRPRYEGKDIEITVSADAEEMWADPSLLRQAVVNLTANAIDAVLEQRGEQGPQYRGKVEIAGRRSSSDFWTISVSDNGKGFDETTERHMFDPFFSTKVDGTGLGLAIVHSVARAHGGQVDVERNAVGGATVRMCIEQPRRPGHV